MSGTASSLTRIGDWCCREGKTPTHEFLRPGVGCGDGPLLVRAAWRDCVRCQAILIQSELAFGLSRDGATCVPKIARSAGGRVGRPPCSVSLMRPKKPIQTDGEVHVYYDLYVPGCFRHHKAVLIQERQDLA